VSKLQVRRGASTLWTSKNPVLGAGEFGYATEGILKIGDGVQSWNALSSIGGGGGGGIAAAAGTETATAGTVVFAHSNGITWGMSGSSQITASHNGLTTAALSDHSHGNPTLALTNLTGTTASASNGLTISLSAAAPGAGGGFAAQGSGTYTQNTGTIQFANSNGITFGLSTNQMTASHNGLTTAAQSDHSHGNPTLALTNLTGTTASASNGFTLSLAAAAPGAAAAVSQYGFAPVFYGANMGLITNVTGTAVSLRCLYFPFFVPGQLTCQELMWYMSRATSGSDLFTIRHGIYSFSNSSRIVSLSTTSAVYSAGNTASNSGIRIWELTPAQTTLSPGNYVLALHFSAANTVSMNYSIMGHSTLNWAPAGVIHPGTNQQTVSSNATSHQLLNFWGRHSVTQSAMPGTVDLNQLWGIGTFALPVMFWFGTHN
jgi:hypothetical protein